MSDKKIPIIVGFSKPKNHIFPIFSWLIRLFEGGTKYSHVYVRWYSLGARVDACYEASGTQVHFVGKKVFDEKIQPVYEYQLEINRETYRKLLHFCMSNAGVKYGIKQVFGIAWQRLNKLLGRKVDNPFSDGNKSWICSELVAAIFIDVVGLEVSKEVENELDSASPKNIKDILDRTKGVKKIL